MSGLIHLLSEFYLNSKKNVALLETILEKLKGEEDTFDNISDIGEHESATYREDNLVNEIHECQDKNLCDDEMFAKYMHSPKEYEELMIRNMETDDEILNRRIAYHKQQGTYEEPKNIPHDEINNNKQEEPIIKITPLSKLNAKDQEAVLKSIYFKARDNVINLLNIDPTNEKFNEEVDKEADRLLELWMIKNKN